MVERTFRATDGTRLRYLEAGQGKPAIVLVPGWLMPAEIFCGQLTRLSATHRTLALDPRGQGRSELDEGRLGPEARARDIDDLVRSAGVGDFVLVGWSLGGMEALDYVTRHRPPSLRAIVIVDNSIGFATPPKPSGAPRPTTPDAFRAYMQRFVRSLFNTPQPPELLSSIERGATRMSPAAAWALLSKPYPREYYREAILGSGVPVLYAIRPTFAAQGDDLLRQYPRARVKVFPGAGHALFVDEPAAFNAELERFVAGL